MMRMVMSDVRLLSTGSVMSRVKDKREGYDRYCVRCKYNLSQINNRSIPFVL